MTDDIQAKNEFFEGKQIPSYATAAQGLRQYLIDMADQGASKDFAEFQERVNRWLQLLTSSYFQVLDHLAKQEQPEK